jgi:hypothetical protein
MEILILLVSETGANKSRGSRGARVYGEAGDEERFANMYLLGFRTTTTTMASSIHNRAHNACNRYVHLRFI